MTPYEAQAVVHVAKTGHTVTFLEGQDRVWECNDCDTWTHFEDDDEPGESSDE